MDSIEESITNVLKNVFGYENFKNDVQKEAIITVSKGSKEVCVSMPPGFGRSLCFQLPVVFCKGKVGIVFSPKLSFMKKEIDFLKSKEINTGLLYKSMQLNERNNILNDLMSDSPTIKLLYATPEMDSLIYFKELIASLRERSLLSYIIFNEAHCLSEWGYEYTPCYKEIICSKIYEYIPKIAVTTTVTDKVIKDICELLTLKTPKIFKIPVQQLNIHYDVWFLDILSHPFIHLKSFIVEVLGFLSSSNHKIHEEFAIVYCREVITAELLKNELSTLGVSTFVYHHRMKRSTQHNIESNWISGKVHVIITTYDYGFIHKKLIRCIIYWTVPENISKYYRECGQTHSDYGDTYCRIYFSIKEYCSVKLLIENHRVMNDVEHIKKRLDEYDKIVSYCLSVKCRHVIISKYFGHVIPSCKTNCDVCKNEEAVEIRTLKFISYSKKLDGIKYNICNVNENLKEEQIEPNVKEQTAPNIKEQTEPNVKKQSEPNIKELESNVKGHPKDNLKKKKEKKKSEASSKEIAAVKDGDKQCIEQSNDKLVKNKRRPSLAKSSSPRKQSADNCIQTSTEDTVKHVKDNSGLIQTNKLMITRSLLDKYNLDKEAISLVPSCAKGDISRTSKLKKLIDTEVYNNQNEQRKESRIVLVLKHNSKIKVDKKEDHVLRRVSREVIINENKQSDKNSRKRFATMDMCPEDFKLKRRKLEPENKPTTGTGINRGRGNATDSNVERIKDDVNGDATCDHAVVEHLMNKYKLNSHSITLLPRKK